MVIDTQEGGIPSTKTNQWTMENPHLSCCQLCSIYLSVPETAFLLPAMFDLPAVYLKLLVKIAKSVQVEEVVLFHILKS